MKFGAKSLVFLQSLACLNMEGASVVEKTSTESVASQTYQKDFIALVEMVYGEGLLSQGGLSSIDEMFEGIDLNGLKVLDLGSGLGMYDIYLAQHNKVEVVGVDPQELLIEQSYANLNKYKKDLQGTVSFLLMKNPHNLNEFPDHSFDIVFSKESILHVPYEFKEDYFKEIYRVLKPGGRIIIMDLLHTSPVYTDHTKKMMEMDGIVFQLLTPLEYQNILENSGFEEIQLKDTTYQHEQLSEQNIESIKALEEKIKSNFGEDNYKYSLESWTYQKEAFQNRELLTGVFTASKK